MVKKWGAVALVGAIDSVILCWLWGAWHHWQSPLMVGQQLLIVITVAFGLSFVAPFLLAQSFQWQPHQVMWHWLLGWLGYGILLLVVPGWFKPAQAIEIGNGFLCSFFGILCVDAPRNRTLGIRVSWTYASEMVWQRTNRLGGWLLYASGLIGIGLSAWKPVAGPVLVFIPVILSGGIALGYAYWLSHQSHLFN